MRLAITSLLTLSLIATTGAALAQEAAPEAQPDPAAAPAEAAPAEAAPAEPATPLAQADALYEKGGRGNIKKSLPLYVKAVEAAPESYEANWKAARAHRDYADESKQQQVKGWEKICASYGKTAMKYGAKAVKLEPSKVEGHQWYGVAVGNYADGVSILTALSEGLKDKTQSAFERAYKLDKMYNDGAPMISLGRFWSVLPWPMKDNDKGLKYLREFQRHFPANNEGRIYLAEVLIDEGGDKNKAEAKKLLEKASKSKVPFFRKRAQELLADL